MKEKYVILENENKQLFQKGRLNLTNNNYEKEYKNIKLKYENLENELENAESEIEIEKYKNNDLAIELKNIK